MSFNKILSSLMLSIFFMGIAFADNRKDTPSIMVSAYSDSDFSKISVTFSELESRPSKEEFSSGNGFRIVSFKSDGSIFEERKLGFAPFDDSLLCTGKEKASAKCPGPVLKKKLVVFMKFSSAISHIKFFHGEKEVSSARVPDELLQFKVKR